VANAKNGSTPKHFFPNLIRNHVSFGSVIPSKFVPLHHDAPNHSNEPPSGVVTPPFFQHRVRSGWNASVRREFGRSCKSPWQNFATKPAKRPVHVRRPGQRSGGKTCPPRWPSGCCKLAAETPELRRSNLTGGAPEMNPHLSRNGATFSGRRVASGSDRL